MVLDVPELDVGRVYRLGIFDLIDGYAGHYPECCVEAFWADVVVGLSPGMMRGLIGGQCGWVPCTEHAEEL